MPQFDLTPAQRDTLIRTALGEARGQGEEGMADVLQVIFNRAGSGRYPSDPARVALQPSQFSTWNSANNGGNNPQQFSPNSRIYQTAARALEAVVGGRPDPTGGALFYHAPSVNPSWSSSANTNGTIRRNGHVFYPTHPVPPGEIPSVGTFLDTVPMPPKPAAPSASVAFRRQNTSPLGDNTALPAALQQYATRKANQVTPATRRPSLPAMGTPNVNSLYAGIYPQQNLTSPGSVEASVRSTAQDPTLAAALARRVSPPSISQSQIDRGQPRIGQSTIDRGISRLPLAQASLTDPGAINASVNGLKQSAPLQAALARSLASPKPVPQSQIERGAPRIGQSTIERGATRLPPAPATQSVDLRQSRAPLPTPIGQPPATRVVQSVPVRPSALAKTAVPVRETALQTAQNERAFQQRPTAATVAAIAPARVAPALTQDQRLAILGNAQVSDRLTPGVVNRNAVNPPSIPDPRWGEAYVAPTVNPMGLRTTVPAPVAAINAVAPARPVTPITAAPVARMPVAATAPISRSIVQAPLMAQIAQRPATMLNALTTMAAPLGFNLGNIGTSAIGRPTANVGQVYGVAGNGGTVTQGHNGLLNSLTQNSDAWRRMTGQGGQSSGRSLSTESGQRSFME